MIDEPRVLLDSAGAQALLGRAWAAVVGKRAPAQTVTLLTAQWSLETDAGRAMHGHNLGGIKAAPGATGASFATVEGYGATRRDAVARFAVYDSAEAGAHDYVRLLASRYPVALEAARVGNVSSFAQALAAGSYFTADPHEYARGLEQRVVALRSGAELGSASSPRAPTEGAVQGLLHALSYRPEDSRNLPPIGKKCEPLRDDPKP